MARFRESIMVKPHVSRYKPSCGVCGVHGYGMRGLDRPVGTIAMPELAEVNRAADILRKVALHRTVRSVLINADHKVFVNGADARMNADLSGREVTAVNRLGKQFFMTLGGTGPNPLFHFGMSGSAITKDGETVLYRTTTKKSKEQGLTWPPPYWKCVITFDNDVEWAYTDTRRFGRITLIDAPDITKVPPLSLLGADPMLNMPTFESFLEQLSHRKAPIKAALLDQNGIFCGIGNWLADEMLFQARIHPAQPCFSIAPEQAKELHTQIYQVCSIACSVDADASRFPKHWLFAHRWDKATKKNKKPQLELPDGTTTTIHWETVGGRTSAITDLQKLVKPAASQSASASSRPSKRKRVQTSDSES